MNRTRMITEQAAAELWRRAAELQAEAEQRGEMRGVPAPAPGGAGGFPLAQVEAAAVEAGIAPEYLHMALAEASHDDAPSSRRMARALLGDTPGSIRVSRVFAAAPAEVLACVQRVLPAYPFRLALAEVEGDPAAGGVMRFEIPPDLGDGQAKLTALRAAAADSLGLTVRAGAGGGCEVVASAVLRPSGTDQMAAAWLVSGFGAAGGGVLTAFTGLVALGLAGPLVLLPALPGLLLGGGVSLAAFRAYYRRCIRGAEVELQALLATLDAHIRTQGAFALPAPPSPSSDGGATVVMNLLT